MNGLAQRPVLERLTGNAILKVVDDLARLRVTVFREFPYLYEGLLEYEQRYLQGYAQGLDNVVVVARDGTEVVGASTGMPLLLEGDEVRRPFIKLNYALETVFYFGESVLMPQYRGLGLGVRFFEEREAHALERGFKRATFCAVERPLEHPRRPQDYVPLDRFWNKRGFVKNSELHTTFEWQDLDESSPSSKPMTFWTKILP